MADCVKNYSDKDMIGDVLSTQKMMTGGYNTVANEAAHPEIKNVFMDILNDEHCIQHDVFDQMSQRGWYATESAPQNKIDTVKQKYCCM
jgi:spore coat protein CotF